jgi:hypothetical protein
MTTAIMTISVVILAMSITCAIAACVLWRAAVCLIKAATPAHLSSKMYVSYVSYVSSGQWDCHAIHTLGVYDSMKLAADAYHSFAADIRLKIEEAEKTLPCDKETYERLIEGVRLELGEEAFHEDCWKWYAANEGLLKWNLTGPMVEEFEINVTSNINSLFDSEEDGL